RGAACSNRSPGCRRGDAIGCVRAPPRRSLSTGHASICCARRCPRITTHMALPAGRSPRTLGTVLAALSLAAWLAGTSAALVQSQEGRRVSWERARAEVARYRATVDTSGLVDVDA